MSGSRWRSSSTRHPESPRGATRDHRQDHSARRGAFYSAQQSRSSLAWSEVLGKPGTTVEVAVNTYGVDLGDGLFGQDNVKTSFKIGDEVITTVDDNTKTLTARRNGEVIRDGRLDGKTAPHQQRGVHRRVRRSHMVMDSSTYGVSGQLAQRVPHRGRLGHPDLLQRHHVHAAPWSVGSQGYSNVSHGCINVSTKNGQWSTTTPSAARSPGDRQHRGIAVVGTDGLGDWNIPWDQWKAGNANL